MFVSSKMYYTVHTLLGTIYLTAMYQIGSLIFSLESGDITMNDHIRKDMFGYLFYLSAAIIQLFVQKKPIGVKDSTGRMIYEGDIVELPVETTEGFYRNDQFELAWSIMNAQFGLKKRDKFYFELTPELHNATYIKNRSK